RPPYLMSAEARGSEGVDVPAVVNVERGSCRVGWGEDVHPTAAAMSVTTTTTARLPDVATTTQCNDDRVRTAASLRSAHSPVGPRCRVVEERRLTAPVVSTCCPPV